MFFQHFASKNQLPGLSISGKLIENGLIYNDNRSSFTELNDVSPKLVSDCFNVNNMTLITLETSALSILSRFALSYMAQNHSPTWDQKYENLLAPHTLYLGLLKSFYDGFSIYQKLSILQRLLKTIQTGLLSRGSESSHETL